MIERVKFKLYPMEKEKMQDFTKRTIFRDVLQLEEKTGPKNLNNVRPFLQSGSAFRPWQPSWKIDINKSSEASSSVEKPYPRPQNFNKTITADYNNNNMNIENSNKDGVQKNPIDSGSTTSVIGDGDVNGIIVRTDEVQFDSECNTQRELDPKRLKRILANRASAQRSRTRKNEYIADLERMEKTFQDKISFLHRQIEASRGQHWLMQLEHHQLKLKMAVREKERVIQEMEIEKIKAEVYRLSELQKKQIVEAQAMMHNMGATIQFMSHSNVNNPPAFEGLVCQIPNQAQNGIEASTILQSETTKSKAAKSAGTDMDG